MKRKMCKPRKQSHSNKSDSTRPEWQLDPALLEQTIATIEKRPQVNPEDFNYSSLTRKVYRIEYESKLRELDGEDLACMLGQQFSLELVVPLSLPLLEKDIMAAGYYEGHLVQAMTSIDPSFWRSHPALWAKLADLIEPHRPLLEDTASIDLGVFFSVLPQQG